MLLPMLLLLLTEPAEPAMDGGGSAADGSGRGAGRSMAEPPIVGDGKELSEPIEPSDISRSRSSVERGGGSNAAAAAADDDDNNDLLPTADPATGLGPA